MVFTSTSYATISVFKKDDMMIPPNQNSIRPICEQLVRICRWPAVNPPTMTVCFDYFRSILITMLTYSGMNRSIPPPPILLGSLVLRECLVSKELAAIHYGRGLLISTFYWLNLVH